MTNTERFTLALTEAYRDLFVNDPEYATVAGELSPEQLADIVTRALAHGIASKDGAGIKRACREVGIKPTYQAIKAFLKETP